MKPGIDPRDRLIVALDVPTKAQALALVDELGDSVNFYKLGMELLTSGSYFELLDLLAKRGKKIFVDLKFFDVPNTVASAMAGLAAYPVHFATVHGNAGMLKAAAAVKGSIRLLAVTALTSLDEADLRELGFACDVKALVTARAKAALEAGCDGVVSSGLEIRSLRQTVGDKLFIVCPGIRPVANHDDQKRTIDVAQAFELGADYIVVGRPIRQAAQPRQAAESMQSDIARVLAHS